MAQLNLLSHNCEETCYCIFGIWYFLLSDLSVYLQPHNCSSHGSMTELTMLFLQSDQFHKRNKNISNHNINLVLILPLPTGTGRFCGWSVTLNLVFSLMPVVSGKNKACRIFVELAAAVTASFVYQRDNEYNPFVQSHRMMRHDDCASLGDSKYQEVPMSHLAAAGHIFLGV